MDLGTLQSDLFHVCQPIVVLVHELELQGAEPGFGHLVAAEDMEGIEVADHVAIGIETNGKGALQDFQYAAVLVAHGNADEVMVLEGKDAAALAKKMDIRRDTLYEYVNKGGNSIMAKAEKQCERRFKDHTQVARYYRGLAII